MTVNIRKEDLRSVKTEKALDIAMFSLLESRNFRKITVSDICTSALISRATFYAHFTDKYDLLRDWLICLKPENIKKTDSYELIEETVNQFVYKNALVIRNLVYDANDETLEIILDSVMSASNFAITKNVDGKRNPEYIVLSNFFAGGMFYYFLWQAKNKFPPDVKPMNIHLYEIIMKFYE